jgi:acetate kinase
MLVLNAGSSSLKFALFCARGAALDRILAGSIDRLGQPHSEFRIKSGAESAITSRRVGTAHHTNRIELILAELSKLSPAMELAAIGHRIVHGGPDFTAPQRVTPKMLVALRGLSSIDAEHLPAEIELLEECQRCLPTTPQIACFDTAFHHDLPRVAQLLPIPRRYTDAGMRRYGFHGLSYEFLLGELVRLGEPAATKGRVILAHLGSGASLAAVRDGRCLDTSMGFTPTAGLVMGTRTGDLDPGIMFYLAQTEKLTATQLNHLLNHDSGLRGISETSSDMRELLARESTEVRAAEAVAVFCYQAKKWIGAFAAALGGLDVLVFSGGIGENCPSVRARICEGLGFLGVELDSAANAKNSATISAGASRVAVRMISTDEELMMARHIRDVISADTSFRSATHEEPSAHTGRRPLKAEIP